MSVNSCVPKFIEIKGKGLVNTDKIWQIDENRIAYGEFLNESGTERTGAIGEVKSDSQIINLIV